MRQINISRSEQGQSIVLIVFALIVLMGFTALAVDGGMMYAARRDAQGVADSAALAAAQAKVEKRNLTWAALQWAAANGFNDEDEDVEVEVFNPPATGAYTGNGEYIQVVITSIVDTSFTQLFTAAPVTNRVFATVRVRPGGYRPAFDGNALVSLQAKDDYTAKVRGSSELVVTGGGIFINSSDGYLKFMGNPYASTPSLYMANSSVPASAMAEIQNKLTITPGGAGITTGMPQYDVNDIPQIEVPDCADGSPVGTVVGSTAKPGYYAGKKFPDKGVTHLEPGVYCIATDFDINGQQELYGAEVFFYLMSGSLKWNGGSELWLSAPTSGPYANILMANPTNAPQGFTYSFTWNGNGKEKLEGTLMLDKSEVNFNGTTVGSVYHGQVITKWFDIGGNGEVAIDYKPQDNIQVWVPDIIEMVE